MLVAEDARFFSHSGIDWIPVHAAISDAFSQRRLPRGASTITQQLARNLWLSPTVNPLRKVKETLLAVQIEQTLSKKQILELYFNVVQFGPTQFGVELEAARLAAGLPAPSQWHPASSSDRYRERVDFVLRLPRDAQDLLAQVE